MYYALVLFRMMDYFTEFYFVDFPQGVSKPDLHHLPSANALIAIQKLNFAYAPNLDK